MKKTEFIARSALCAALYASLTMACLPLSYGMVQFRISEVMTLLTFFNPSYIPSLLVGCFVANLLGPGGIVDAVFGTCASLFAFIWIVIARKIKNKKAALFVAAAGPAASSFIIAYEMRLLMMNEYSFCIWFLYIAFGQAVVLYVLGCPLALYVEKNERIMKLIKK